MAISFLSGDEPQATQLYDALSDNLKVFVNSKRQKELGGTDGLEAFRQPFFSLAIKDRLFNGGGESLLFGILDEKSTPPGWLPEHLVRAVELGVKFVGETALQQAQRVESNRAARREKQSKLSVEAPVAFASEWKNLTSLLA